MSREYLQRKIEEIGEELLRHSRARKPAAFSPRSVTGKLMEWSMRDERLKADLFRFVDVFPGLESSRDIAEHAQAYLGENESLPRTLRWVLRNGFAPVTAAASRFAIQRMAKLFIAASGPQDAFNKVEELRAQGFACTADILGETVVSEKEADHFAQQYVDLIEQLAAAANSWPEIPQLDRDDKGLIPKVNVSIKLSALYSRIRTTAPDDAVEGILTRLVPIAEIARKHGVFLNLDMESTSLKGVTYEVFKQLLQRVENAQFGLAIQAYLKDTHDDVINLVDWCRKNNQHITVRLIKGAYWDYEVVMARQRNWPVPVFEHKPQTDSSYERLARLLLEQPQTVSCAFGTHNVRSIAACIANANDLNLPPNVYEFQMLYGMAEPIKHALRDMGYRVRDYCPIGEMLPGMSYLVRRLLENTSNESFLRITYSDKTDSKELLKDPAEATYREAEVESGFRNEPLTDFTIGDNRERMKAAITLVRQDLGKTCFPIINGEEHKTASELVSRNPANPDEIIGIVQLAGRQQADAALQCRTRKMQSPETRSRLLEKLAELIRRDRFTLAALEVLETGKTWIEADADIAEAIDFCNYNASELRRLSRTNFSVPGETNIQRYLPRGIALIIAPWNFPLAILCGMTTAALAGGNCVLVKPAEQSSIIAARFARLVLEAGFPAESFHFLPGFGEEIGAYLVAHHKVNLIAFTGSREVGIKIWETASKVQPGQQYLKKVVCEMGGKNALIVDSDADLDEAIPGILTSAFGYQGQKCSALSRLIVVESIYSRLLARLIEAAKGLLVGPPEDPRVNVGPVISAEAKERIERYIEKGVTEGKLVFRGEVPAGSGYFVPPVIFTDVPPESALFQEENFGPVLSIHKAPHLDAAIEMANNSIYALTGGLYSRNPASIEKVKNQMLVGNLYINRPITGALVGRQPFGGFKMSGGGTKAGGPDYLHNFMVPQVITENTLRHGFAPPARGE